MRRADSKIVTMMKRPITRIVMVVVGKAHAVPPDERSVIQTKPGPQVEVCCGSILRVIFAHVMLLGAMCRSYGPTISVKAGDTKRFPIRTVVAERGSSTRTYCLLRSRLSR